MNRQNIKAAIALMKRAGASVDMANWQTPADRVTGIKLTEEDLYACGNKACFAGFVAVSPEFKASGGTCSCRGSPQFQGKDGHCAISAWLDIPMHTAYNLVTGNVYNLKHYSHFYGKPWPEVTNKDVIAELRKLLILRIF